MLDELLFFEHDPHKRAIGRAAANTIKPSQHVGTSTHTNVGHGANLVLTELDFRYRPPRAGQRSPLLMYEVIRGPLKVRRHFEYNSAFVAQLPVGTQVVPVEARRTSEGAQRVCVVVVGDERPVGWITARHATTGNGVAKRTVREVVPPKKTHPRWPPSTPHPPLIANDTLSDPLTPSPFLKRKPTSSAPSLSPLEQLLSSLRGSTRAEQVRAMLPEGVLTVRSLAAHGVPDADMKAGSGISDPYVRISLLDAPRPDYEDESDGLTLGDDMDPVAFREYCDLHQLAAQTATIMNDADPVWEGEVLQIRLPAGTSRSPKVLVRVWDEDETQADEPIGSTEVLLDPSGGSFSRLKLRGRDGLADFDIDFEYSLSFKPVTSVFGAFASAPAPRKMKPWDCTGCHRCFEEAVNSSEKLPTDPEYYEKLAAGTTFRYCSQHCLNLHRRAGFPDPSGFTCQPPS